MEMTVVRSSNLAKVGYSQNTELLAVEFHDGSVYEFYDVPENEYKALMAAPSLGRYFNLQIKPKYRCRKVS